MDLDGQSWLIQPWNGNLTCMTMELRSSKDLFEKATRSTSSMYPNFKALSTPRVEWDLLKWEPFIFSRLKIEARKSTGGFRQIIWGMQVGNINYCNKNCIEIWTLCRCVQKYDAGTEECGRNTLTQHGLEWSGQTFVSIDGFAHVKVVGGTVLPYYSSLYTVCLKLLWLYRSRRWILTDLDSMFVLKRSTIRIPASCSCERAFSLTWTANWLNFLHITKTFSSSASDIRRHWGIFMSILVRILQ